MRRLKVAVAVAIAIAVFAAARLLPVAAWVAELQRFARDAGPAGAIIYAAAYALAALVLPGSLLTIAAGAIFGVVRGTLVVLCGATAAATIAFVLARTVLRRRIESMMASNQRFQAVDRAIGREGAKIVFLVRLAAVFPFTIVNYLFGLTSIPLGRYVLTTVVGILPGTVAFVYIGTAGAAAATRDRTSLLFTIGGAIAALVVSVLVGRIAAKAIRTAGVDDVP